MSGKFNTTSESKLTRSTGHETSWVVELELELAEAEEHDSVLCKP